MCHCPPRLRKVLIALNKPWDTLLRYRGEVHIAGVRDAMTTCPSAADIPLFYLVAHMRLPA